VPSWKSRRTALLVFLLGLGTAALAVSVVAWRRPPRLGGGAAWELEEIAAGLPRSGQWRSAFDLADLDSDGRLDLVHGPPRKGGGGPRVFLGGAEGWRPWAELGVLALAYDYGAAAVADFESRRASRSGARVHLRGLLVLAGEGPGRFVAPPEGLAFGPGAFSSRALAAADWDGDGAPELLALSDGPRPFAKGGADRSAAVGLRSSAPRRPREELDGKNPANPRSATPLATGDVDGDGVLDAATSSNVAGLRGIVHRGTRSGREIREVAELPERALVPGVALGDLTGTAAPTSSLRPSAPKATMEDQPRGAAVRGDRFERRTWLEGRPPERLGPGRGRPRRRRSRRSRALDVEGSLRLFRNDGRGQLHAVLALLPLPAWRSGCGGTHLRLTDLDGMDAQRSWPRSRARRRARLRAAPRRRIDRLAHRRDPPGPTALLVATRSAWRRLPPPRRTRRGTAGRSP
jgi:hypothetical protein